MDRELRPRFDAATGASMHAGIYAGKFSRDKLRHDPVFFSLLLRDLLFHITVWTERRIGMARGWLRQTLYYRRTGEWIGLLEGIGFHVSVEPMSEATPFANVLFVTKK